MLRPFLLIGVGGSGGKTLRIVHHELERLLGEIGWDEPFPAGWQFLHVDVPSVADGNDPDLPAQLQQGEYAGLVTAGINYRTIDTALAGTGRTREGDSIAGWRPLPEHVKVPVERGAGQFRALGRIITLANMRSVKSRLDDAMRNISGREVTGQLMELTRLLGGTPSNVQKPPVAVVVSSIAGGSGAGAAIDVCDLLRASGPGVWPSESVGILYSPDVFDYLDPARRRGVRPNALATLAELVAGYWNNKGPSQETIGILNRQGVAVGDVDRLGPRYSFIVGAKNDYITFRTQNDIYAAMGRSLASWVSSPVLQDRMDAYVSGNWSASAISVPDELGMKTNEMETPFTAMGSARVGLGRDRFRDYAAQRLARGAVELLLNRHEQRRARGDERPPYVIAQEIADNAFAGFLENSNLNERTEEKNEILDAFRPTDREVKMRQLMDSIYDQVTSNSPPKGLTVSEWRDRISQRVREVIDRTLDEFDVENRARGRVWVTAMQPDFRRLSARTLSQEGTVVTALLLRKLADELRAVRTELEQEASKYLRSGENFEGEIDSALRSADGDLLPREHPSVRTAVRRGIAAVHYRAEARLRQLVVGIIPDLVNNVVIKMAEEIERAGQGLLAERSPANAQPSAISSWPEGEEVPKVLRPAANEFLLEDPDTFAQSLNRLILRSTEAQDLNGAYRRTLRAIIEGSDDASTEDQRVVRQPSAWTPAASELHVELSSAQRADFDVRISAGELLARATAWLTRPGTPAGSFVAESLNHYLSDSGAEAAEVSERLARFEQRLNGAVDAAQPLIGIKKSVLVAVHGRHEIKSETFFSEIPVASSSNAAKVVQKVLESKGLWSAETSKNFAESERSFIDAFTVLVEPYEPVVFDSLMKPIAEEWGDRSKTADGREEFWRWRRARALPEFVPAAPAVTKAMVRGWFTANLFGQVRLEDSSASIFVPNPVGGNGAWRSFPKPMLASGITANHEYLPLALESLPLAWVELSTTADLNVMAPYKRLRDLGTSGSGGLDVYEALNPELSRWIAEARLPQGAPEPNSEFAGAANDKAEGRQAAILGRLETLAGTYRTLFDQVERRSELLVPRADELRDEITTALEELQRVVRETDPSSSRTDVWN
ncbi:hypothetical protein ISU07_17865 [Nocardioides islandensis]|uniref:Tubulin-like protein n=1 Tax=Nocardioides islandensis TaxID=433663 RepID=A0A930VED0_9ACTN|nr:tubulin-like doman-containing protein [Nocardioides islandensis]MBF4765002.1 hypothetical protein [Nocardioides islandensis]